MLLKELLVLLTSLGFVFLWQNTASNTATYVIFGLVIVGVISLFLLSARKHKYNVLTVLTTYPSWSLFLFTTLILLAILTTGGVTSVLFFLLYFLSFSIAFAYSLPVLLLYLVGISIILFPDIMSVDVFTNVTRFIVLIVILPAAYYFGRDFRSYQNTKKV